MKKSERDYYIETYGELDYPLVLLYKQFKKNQSPFMYVAVQMNGLWYVTSKSEVYTTPELLQFFETDNLIGPEGIFALQTLADFEQVFEEEQED